MFKTTTASYKKLVRNALAKGASISVWDGEEWQVKRSVSCKQIIEAIESVEEAQVRIRDAEGNQIGWALIIPFAVDNDETVADHTDNAFMHSLAI
jgi:hypothetical protein